MSVCLSGWMDGWMGGRTDGGRGWIQELISFNSNVNSLGFAPIQPVALKELTLEVILLALLVERQEN